MEAHEYQMNRIGEYQFSYTIGKGTAGKVKLAKNVNTNEDVAIKIIAKESFHVRANLEMKVQREIALMRLVHHPNILSLIDVLESNRHLYIVLEYAQHGELFEFLVSRRSLSEDIALEFFRQIVLAIEYLHQHGICHRDLKPENILLDGANRVKIADFGFARWVKSDVTETSCGSPHYAAPEVIKGQAYNGRIADIWSMGVILYALLAGYLPFDDPNIRNLLRKVKKGTFVMPNFSDPVKDLIQKMLTIETDKRITIQEIKQHPCFRKGLDPSYILPSPIPLAGISDPIDISTVPESIMTIMRQIGFESLEELKELLASASNNMAKVFLSMLTTRIDFDALPWGESNKAYADTLVQSGFMAGHGQNKDEPASLTGRFLQSESIGSVKSYARRWEWGLDDTAEVLFSTVIETRGVGIWTIMKNIEDVIISFSMDWFHPDPQTIYARHENGPSYISTNAVFVSPEQINLEVSIIRGEQSVFIDFTQSLRQRFSK